VARSKKAPSADRKEPRNGWLTVVKIVVSVPWYRLERLGISGLRNAENPRIHTSFRNPSPNRTKAFLSILSLVRLPIPPLSRLCLQSVTSIRPAALVAAAENVAGAAAFRSALVRFDRDQPPSCDTHPVEQRPLPLFRALDVLSAGKPLQEHVLPWLVL